MDYKEALAVRTKQVKTLSEEYRNNQMLIENLENELIFYRSKIDKIDSLYHDVRVSDDDFINEIGVILEEIELNR